MFLVLLCNDRAVLAPWVNTVRQNIITWAIVWSLVLLSLTLTAPTFFPGVSTAANQGRARRRRCGRHRGRNRREAEAIAQALGGGPDLDPVDRPDDTAPVSHAERRAVQLRDRLDWQTPNLVGLERPAMSPIRRMGLFTTDHSKCNS